MNKKIIIIVLTILIFATLSGCIKKEEKTDQNNKKDHNQNVVEIFGPEKAYFGQTIVFNVIESIKNINEIISYEWDFGDSQTDTGKQVEHTYEFENDINIEYPLIYTIRLKAKDQYENLQIANHQIMLYPSVYTFYLDTNKLTIEKPSTNEDVIGLSGKFNLKPAQELIYTIEGFVKIQKCKWNASIYLKIPILIVADNIIFTLYNENGEEISKGEQDFRRFNFLDNEPIVIRGEINNQEEFKSAKLSIYGFSFGKKISILYGDEKPSKICFNFTE